MTVIKIGTCYPEQICQKVIYFPLHLTDALKDKVCISVTNKNIILANSTTWIKPFKLIKNFLFTYLFNHCSVPLSSYRIYVEAFFQMVVTDDNFWSQTLLPIRMVFNTNCILINWQGSECIRQSLGKENILSFYGKFIQDNRCQILKQVTKFYRKHTKHTKHSFGFFETQGYLLSKTARLLRRLLSLRFNGHFPREPGLASVYWSKGWWRWWVVTTGLLEL